MLRARLFDDFKSARSLLVWGDISDVSALEQNLLPMMAGDVKEAVLGCGGDALTLRLSEQADHSSVTADGGNLLWECSIDTLQKALDFVGPLLTMPGHQYIDTSGAAEQVIISAGEYPQDFAR